MNTTHKPKTTANAKTIIIGPSIGKTGGGSPGGGGGVRCALVSNTNTTRKTIKKLNLFIPVFIGTKNNKIIDTKKG